MTEHDAAEPDQQLTTAMLKAYANPLRRAIMRELSVRPHARLVDLSKLLDEPANKLAFHLKQLAAAGLIEEAPEFARDNRDRVWRVRVRHWRVGNAPEDIDEAIAFVRTDEAEHAALSARAFSALASRFVDGQRERRAGFIRGTVRLTEAQFNELFEKIYNEIDALEKRQQEADVPPEARAWELHFLAANDTA